MEVDLILNQTKLEFCFKNIGIESFRNLKNWFKDQTKVPKKTIKVSKPWPKVFLYKKLKNIKIICKVMPSSILYPIP